MTAKKPTSLQAAEAIGAMVKKGTGKGAYKKPKADSKKKTQQVKQGPQWVSSERVAPTPRKAVNPDVFTSKATHAKDATTGALVKLSPAAKTAVKKNAAVKNKRASTNLQPPVDLTGM